MWLSGRTCGYQVGHVVIKKDMRGSFGCSGFFSNEDQTNVHIGANEHDL